MKITLKQLKHLIKEEIESMTSHALNQDDLVTVESPVYGNVTGKVVGYLTPEDMYEFDFVNEFPEDLQLLLDQGVDLENIVTVRIDRVQFRKGGIPNFIYVDDATCERL